MKRREFIKLIGSAVAAWPLAARAQQPSMPVIGWLSAAPTPEPRNMEAFRHGLSGAGFIDGQSVRIEYRWAENGYAQLPELAADLVSRKVDAIIASGGSVSALAAKKVTRTIPIVFASVGADPIKVGLVPNLNRPGGNLTGNTISSNELSSKKLEILHGLVPPTAAIALVINPGGSTAESVVQDTEEAARALGRRLLVLRASNEREIDIAFTGVAEQRAGGVVFAPDGFFGGRRIQLAALAARFGIPAIYEGRAYVLAGGLISYGADVPEGHRQAGIYVGQILKGAKPGYGADVPEGHRQAGIYVGQILKGAKPGDLPVLQPTKFDLVINLKAAKALGITIPNELLIRATELIE